MNNWLYNENLQNQTMWGKNMLLVLSSIITGSTNSLIVLILSHVNFVSIFQLKLAKTKIIKVFIACTSTPFYK